MMGCARTDALTARTSGDPALRAKVKGRRLVNAATKQRIRATLSMARALSYDARLMS
jgi:hypothetical protein